MSVRLKISLALCALIAILTLSSALNWRFASHQGQLLEGTNEELISSAEKTASLRQMAKDLQLNVVIIQQAISALSSGLAAEDKVIEHQGDQFTRALSSARQLTTSPNRSAHRDQAAGLAINAIVDIVSDELRTHRQNGCVE